MSSLRRPRATVFALAVVVSGFLAGQCAPATPAPAVVTVLHINDVHEMDATEAGRVGGLARVATVLGELRRTSEPVVVTLGGDYLSPAAIGTARVDGELLAGRQAVAVLNLLGVQWATLGNHEFDFPEATFLRRLSESRFRIVSSNVTDAAGKPFDHTVPSAIVPVQAGGRTIRLGLIGLTIDFNRRPWVRYLPAVEAARTAVAALRGRTDAVVALTHLGLTGDQAVAAAIPELDLVLGGHEHENWMLRRGPRFTPIVKADANGRSVVVATLTFAGAGSRPSVTARIIPMDDSVGKHAGVQAEIDRWMTLGFDAFRREGFAPEEVVAVAPEPLDGRESVVRNRPGNLTDLVTAAMLREVERADLAILNGGSVRVDDLLPAGPLRQYDVIRILPFGGKVLGASLEGALLAQVLDAGALNQGSGGYLHMAGVERQNAQWVIQGKPLHPRTRYRVALPEFLLTGGEARLGFLTRSHPQVHDVLERRDIRQVLLDEIRRRYKTPF